MRIPVAGAVAVLIVTVTLGPAGQAWGAKDVFSDDAVEKAIAKAVAFLWKAQRADGSWPAIVYVRTQRHQGSSRAVNVPPNTPTFLGHAVGAAALPAYALLESGVKITDPRMAKALEYLAKAKTVKTYSLGVRANVWLEAAGQDEKYTELLKQDLAMLISSSKNGAYSYDCNGDGNSGTWRKDNSASQYALLGVWAGARANAEVPPQYWRLVMKHWKDCQNSDGGWGYLVGQPPNDKTTATMTAAGVASLFVCYDNLTADDAAIIRCKPSKLAEEAEKPITAGLKWFDRNFITSFGGNPYGLYYYLYGVERVGLASGRKYFGKKDWYRIGATMLLRRQLGDGSWQGSWGGREIGTAFALLFLVRGRNAVLFNKLEYNGDWNTRPRDLASLTRWISGNFESKVNWQIVNTSVPVTEWHDAPILYISGYKAPQFTAEDLAAMRTFVHQGGTIFSVAACRGRRFTQGMYAACRKMFPKYELTGCKPNHELHNVHYRLPGPPWFTVISNGVRPLVIHTTDDLSLSWQTRKYATRKRHFQAAANVLMYVTDKGTAPRRRGTTLWPAPPATRPEKTVSLARLKYKGNYDPEPLAYERFSRLMARHAKTGVKVLGPMAIADLPAGGAKLAVLTGTEKFSLAAEEIKAIKAFITAGGTLFIDAAGGEKAKANKGFVASVNTVLAAALDDAPLKRLAAKSPLYMMPKMEIRTVKWRRATHVAMGGNTQPMLQTITVEGRPAVLFSRLDITAGLLGTPAAGIHGYHPGDVKDPGTAFRLMRNIILYAYTDRPGPLPQ